VHEVVKLKTSHWCCCPGVGGGNSAQHIMVLAGVAALVGGALSMAVGEYISVASQRDAEEADIEKERREQAKGNRGKHIPRPCSSLGSEATTTKHCHTGLQTRPTRFPPPFQTKPHAARHAPGMGHLASVWEATHWWEYTSNW
jgi:VIT family